MYQPGGGPRQPELDFEKIMGDVRNGIGRVAQRLGGGGVGLAAVADFVFVGPDATFSLSEVKLGILPAVIGPYVVRRVGVARARGLFGTAWRINARDAVALHGERSKERGAGIDPEDLEAKPARRRAVDALVDETGAALSLASDQVSELRGQLGVVLVRTGFDQGILESASTGEARSRVLVECLHPNPDRARGQ